MNGNYPRLSNRSPEVHEDEIQDILNGELADPTVSSLGSRIEAVNRLDGRAGGRPRADDLAALLGVTKRTIERYRRMIRTDTLR